MIWTLCEELLAINEHVHLHIQFYNFAAESFRLDNNCFVYFFTSPILILQYFMTIFWNPNSYDTVECTPKSGQ